MKYVTSALVLTAILVPAVYLTAQDAEPGPGTLEEEMSALNVTMKEIAVLLEKHVAGQETDLLIKRVDLTNRALLSRREELRKARAEVLDLTEAESEMRANLEGYQESLSEGNVREEDQRILQFEVDQLERRLKPLQARRQDLERRIVELENDVMTSEEDMRILKDVLDEKLGLR